MRGSMKRSSDLDPSYCSYLQLSVAKTLTAFLCHRPAWGGGHYRLTSFTMCKQLFHTFHQLAHLCSATFCSMNVCYYGCFLTWAIWREFVRTRGCFSTSSSIRPGCSKKSDVKCLNLRTVVWSLFPLTFPKSLQQNWKPYIGGWLTWFNVAH